MAYILLILRFSQPKARVCKATTLEEWHRRFGHVGKNTIKKMLNIDAVHGINVVDTPEDAGCSECALSKSHRTTHHTRTTSRASEPGISLHFDTVGFIKQASLGGAQYAVLCKDEYSGYRMIAFVSNKSDIVDEVKLCISMAELETKNRVRQIITDNGTEYKNEQLSSFLKNHGISHEFSVAYTPQQNGFIERDIRTVFECGRTMLIDSRLPESLWAEAMNTAVYVLNRTEG